MGPGNQRRGRADQFSKVGLGVQRAFALYLLVIYLECISFMQSILRLTQACELMKSKRVYKNPLHAWMDFELFLPPQIMFQYCARREPIGLEQLLDAADARVTDEAMS